MLDQPSSIHNLQPCAARITFLRTSIATALKPCKGVGNVVVWGPTNIYEDRLFDLVIDDLGGDNMGNIDPAGSTAQV